MDRSTMLSRLRWATFNLAFTGPLFAGQILGWYDLPLWMGWAYLGISAVTALVWLSFMLGEKS